MLLSTFIKEGTAALEHLYPTAEAKTIVLTLCEDVLGTKNYTHIIEPQYQIPAAKEPKLEAAMGRLAAGEPIQYVTGKAEWSGLTFKVTPDVLIPRPETELLCRQAIHIGQRIQRMRIPYGKKAWPVRVLDLCTGSGCIAWYAALNIPGAKVVGVDISEEALSIATSQDFSTQLRECGGMAPEFVKCDVLKEGEGFGHGEFDLILSNPPYIMEHERSILRINVKDYEPAMALFVPDDNPLLFHRAIAQWSLKYLAKDGTGLTEINEVLGTETVQVFREAGFRADIIKDFYGRNRFVSYKR